MSAPLPPHRRSLACLVSLVAGSFATLLAAPAVAFAPALLPAGELGSELLIGRFDSDGFVR